MATSIEKYDELMQQKGRRQLQSVPNQPHGGEGPPNWEYYQTRERLLLEDQSGHDLAKILKSFWFHRGIFATIGLILATFFVLANPILLPDTYEATARVRVKMVGLYDDSRSTRNFSIIPTEVLSDKVLTKVIKNLEMTKKTTDPFIARMLTNAGIEPKTNVTDGSGIIRWLRQDVRINQERQGAATAVFTVSLIDSDPSAASSIVNEIVTTYMDLRHTFESSDASEAVMFLQPKVDAAKETVDDAHAELTKFQMENTVYLVPAQSIEENISRLQEEYTDSNNRVDQLTELNKGLRTLLKDEPRYVSSGTISTDSVSIAAAELATLKQRYVVAQARYVKGHPYLKQLSSEIQALNTQADKTPIKARRVSGRVSNPEWLRLSQEITSNGAEVRVLGKRLPSIKRHIIELTDHLARSTSAQSALLSHQSAWEQAYSHYRDINGRYLAARTQAEAQQSDVGRELSILDNAAVPTLPISASRIKLQVLSMVGGFLIAFVLVVIYTRVKNWEIPEGGKQVGILTSIFLNLFGMSWFVMLIGYIIINPYL